MGARFYQASHLRDLDLLGRKDAELAPVIFEGDWCFVTKNARDFRGPDDAKGSTGEYAGVDLRAGSSASMGHPKQYAQGGATSKPLRSALDLIDQHGSDGDQPASRGSVGG